MGLTPRTTPDFAFVAASSRSLRFFSSTSTLSLRSSSCFFFSSAARFCSRSAALRSASSFSCKTSRVRLATRHLSLQRAVKRTFLAAAAARWMLLTCVSGFLSPEGGAPLPTERFRPKADVDETDEARLVFEPSLDIWAVLVTG